MNTFTPYIAGASCILKRGDRADHRMTELNELIASAKGSSVRAFTEAFFVSAVRKEIQGQETWRLPKAGAGNQSGRRVAFKKKRRK
jgi:hypothetical protein